jgi:hypothetical protein
MTELEKTLGHLMELRSSACFTFSEDFKKHVAFIRDKCILAEKTDGEAVLQWRKGPPQSKDRNNLHNRWRPQTGPKPTKPVGIHSRYVSKFKNEEGPVEDKILNQVILNKLNKFSAANYDEIKLFLQQILDNDEKEFLQNFMLLVFKKAAAEPIYCGLYARMISELSAEYEILRNELKVLYDTYLDIFEEVSEEKVADYEAFVQRNREKNHRLGYSQFLAELTTLGVLEQEQLEKIFTTLISQIRIYGAQGETKQQLVDEYIDCLLRMTKAFQNKNNPKLSEIRQGLAKHCEEPMRTFLSQRSSTFPGISKKSSFGIMDCLDIFTAS